MPWRCPACRTEVQHDPIEGRPRVGQAYRCPVCRLDLRFNEAEDHMEIAPLETDHAVQMKSDRAKTLPTPMPLRTANPKKPRGSRAR